MKNIIKHEFKRNFRSLVLWSTIIVGLSVLMLVLFPAFEDSMGEMLEMLDAWPAGFLEAFGLGEGGLDMGNIYGWYGVEGYLFVLLIGGSYSAVLGSSILSKEEDEKTIEFLLSKPVSRTKIIFGKIFVIILNLFLLNLLMSIVLFFSFVLFGEFDFLVWALFSFAPLLHQFFFASISFLISVFITKSRAVISISLGLVIGLYVVEIISKLTDSAEFLKYLTPYEYVNAVDIVNNNNIQGIYLLITFIVITLSFVLAWMFYNKKDITT